jgi:mono/diheme cytochrome c family protein
MKLRVLPNVSWLVPCLVLTAGPARAQSAPGDAALLFNARCAGCHTFGQGDKVGPDLKGVSKRHSRAWLLSWIRSSERMVKAADPTAAALYRKYGRQRMPDFDLPTERLTALLDYLAAGGPEQDQARQMRAANTATAQEVEHGRRLFDGRVALASGAVACVSCHTVASRGTLGGSLGPDLSAAFARYRDRGLHQYLQRTCFPRTQDVNAPPVLTADESLALRAYLRASDPGQPAQVARHDVGPPSRPVR